MSNPIILDVQDLSKVYRRSKGKTDSTTALNRVSLTVPAYSITALVGSNGSGKTTLMNLISGIDTPTIGQIHSYAPQKPDTPCSISFVSSKDTLFPELTVIDNLRYRADIHSRPYSELAPLLNMFQAHDLSSRKPTELSTGQKQKVLLVCALVNQPDIVLLDEITSGIDIQARQEVYQSLKTIALQKTTVLIATHDISEIYALCNRMIVLNAGVITYSGELPKEHQSIQSLHEAFSSLLSRTQPQ